MGSHDYTYEYWDVYLEPGKGSATAFLCRIKLIIHAKVQLLCQDLRTRPSQETTIIAQKLSHSSSNADIPAREITPTVGMKTLRVFYLHD